MGEVREIDWMSLVGGDDSLIATCVAPGILRLSERVLEPGSRSYFYLVRGDDADCLIDGGWGFCRTLEGLRAEKGKPLLAIATHSHFDHIGLLNLADRRWAHPAEEGVYASPDPVATQALPFLAGLRVLDSGDCLAPGSIRQSACPLTDPAFDGCVVDLGGRRLSAFHTPGHSPGSLSILDEATGTLFCADTVHDGHIYDDIPGADPAVLARSQRRLLELDFDQACPGHGAVMSRSAFRARVELYQAATGAG